MNIATRLAIIEQLLEGAVAERHGRLEIAPFKQPAGEERWLVDNLDQVQILKAATYFRPPRHGGG